MAASRWMRCCHMQDKIYNVPHTARPAWRPAKRAPLQHFQGYAHSCHNATVQTHLFPALSMRAPHLLPALPTHILPSMPPVALHDVYILLRLYCVLRQHLLLEITPLGQVVCMPISAQNLSTTNEEGKTQRRWLQSRGGTYRSLAELAQYLAGGGGRGGHGIK